MHPSSGLCVLLAILCIANCIIIRKLDPFLNVSHVIELPVTIGIDIAHSSIELCNKLYHNIIEFYEYQRCITLTSQRIRDAQISLIHLANTYYNITSYNDGELFSLGYIYNENNSNNNGNIDSSERVCVFGDAIDFSSISIMMSSTAIKYFDWFIEDSRQLPSKYQYDILNSFAEHTATMLTIHLGNPEDLFKQMHKIATSNSNQSYYCSRFHIQNLPYDRMRRLIDIATFSNNNNSIRSSSSSDSSQNVLLSDSIDRVFPVVWVDDFRLHLISNNSNGDDSFSDNNATPTVKLSDQYPGVPEYISGNTSALIELRIREQLKVNNNSEYSIIDWIWSSVWSQESLFEFRECDDGFTGRHFQVHQDTSASLKLRQINYGELLINSKNNSNDSSNKNKHRNNDSRNNNNNSNSDSSNSSNNSNTGMIVIITYTIRVFSETAFGLRLAIRRLGYDSVFILSDFSVDLIKGLYSITDSSNNSILQIALGPHDPAILLPHYIVFQMEQTWSHVAFQPYLNFRYALIMSRAVCVWCYSYVHADMLRTLGYPCVRVVPLYSADADATRFGGVILTDLQRQKRWQNALSDANEQDEGSDNIARSRIYGGPSTEASEAGWAIKPKEEFNTQVLFYGSCTERRINIIKHVRYLNNNNNYTMRLICAHWETAIFDTMRFAHVSSATILINVHGDSNSVLEVHRINYLLSLGKCIISERGTDASLASYYDNVIYFIDNYINDNKKLLEDDLEYIATVIYRLIVLLITDTQLLKECKDNARYQYKLLSKNITVLSLALQDNDNRMIN